MTPASYNESYVRGPEAELLRKPVGELFLDTAHRFPNRLALVSLAQGIRLTWSEYAYEVHRAAAGLRALGLQPGQRIGVWATNCAEWAYLQFGAAVAGIVLVNLNPAYRSHELSFVLERSGIEALFLRESDAHSDYRAILTGCIEDASREGRALRLRHIVYIGTEDWAGFMRPADGISTEVDPGAVANMQYTSGTTGHPKGVLLTHINIVNNARYSAGYMRTTEQDVVCVPVPLFHCFGCVIGTMLAAATGAAVVLPAETFVPRITLEAIEREHCTAIYGVPAMFISELNHPDFPLFNLTSLRTGIMAGAPCPIEIMRRVVSEMHCPEMLVAYGQTESSPVITMSRAEDTVETRCQTVGCALPETEVRLVSPEGETVAVGEQGELLARGYTVMSGYDGEPEATARAIDSEGWLHTGDLAMMRPDGCFRITGRAKDMIIRGGENISPREIEEFLYTHPAVADVQIVGLPDDRLGETVLAWIKLKPGESATAEDIQAFCRGRLAHFKIPQHIKFVDSYPMTLSGKVRKYKIREIEIAERGLQKTASQETA